jgi:anti-sigma B factor antagonist
MKVQQIGSATVASLMEHVDSMTCKEVESTLRASIATNPRQVICDCSATKYISSAGLWVFLAAAQNLKKAGGQLALVCAKRNSVYEVLELSGITHIVPVFETVDDAMAKLS